MTRFLLYLIIDDDAVNNMICRMVIRKEIGNVHIKDFVDPVKGLEYIISEFKEATAPAVLLLDINMPAMTGWEFLESFEKFDTKIKKQFNIYILSSSVNQSDRESARTNKNVKGYISKPLNQEIVKAIEAGQTIDI